MVNFWRVAATAAFATGKGHSQSAAASCPGRSGQTPSASWTLPPTLFRCLFFVKLLCLLKSSHSALFFARLQIPQHAYRYETRFFNDTPVIEELTVGGSPKRMRPEAGGHRETSRQVVGISSSSDMLTCTPRVQHRTLEHPCGARTWLMQTASRPLPSHSLPARQEHDCCSVPAVMASSRRGSELVKQRRLPLSIITSQRCLRHLVPGIVFQGESA